MGKLLLVLFLSGCATLGNNKVAATCQAADGITTYYALTHGAKEVNPLLANVSPQGILFIKLAIAYIIWKMFDRETTETEKAALTGTALLGCIPAISNLKVING